VNVTAWRLRLILTGGTYGCSNSSQYQRRPSHGGVETRVAPLYREDRVYQARCFRQLLYIGRRQSSAARKTATYPYAFHATCCATTRSYILIPSRCATIPSVGLAIPAMIPTAIRIHDRSATSNLAPSNTKTTTTTLALSSSKRRARQRRVAAYRSVSEV